MKVRLKTDIMAKAEINPGDVRDVQLSAGNEYELKIVLNGPPQPYFPAVGSEGPHLSGHPNPQFELPVPNILLKGSAFEILEEEQ